MRDVAMFLNSVTAIIQAETMEILFFLYAFIQKHVAFWNVYKTNKQKKIQAKCRKQHAAAAEHCFTCP